MELPTPNPPPPPAKAATPLNGATSAPPTRQGPSLQETLDAARADIDKAKKMQKKNLAERNERDAATKRQAAVTPPTTSATTTPPPAQRKANNAIHHAAADSIEFVVPAKREAKPEPEQAPPSKEQIREEQR